MAICMAKTIKEERLRWVLPIINKEARMVDAAKMCPYGKRSLERWVSEYRKYGEAGLEPKSTEPKAYRVETPIWLKESIFINARTIGKILKKEELVRKYRVKKIKYKYIRAERKPGELLEIDVKHVPGKVAGKRYFQYTAIDTAGRWRHMEVFDEETTHHSIKFLKIVMSRFPHQIKAIKTENGSIFTNYYVGTNKRINQTVKTIHALDRFCAEHGIVHYLIDPGKPAQSS